MLKMTPLVTKHHSLYRMIRPSGAFPTLRDSGSFVRLRNSTRPYFSESIQPTAARPICPCRHSGAISGGDPDTARGSSLPVAPGRRPGHRQVTAGSPEGHRQFHCRQNSRVKSPVPVATESPRCRVPPSPPPRVGASAAGQTRSPERRRSADSAPTPRGLSVPSVADETGLGEVRLGAVRATVSPARPGPSGVCVSARAVWSPVSSHPLD